MDASGDKILLVSATRWQAMYILEIRQLLGRPCESALRDSGTVSRSVSTHTHRAPQSPPLHSAGRMINSRFSAQRTDLTIVLLLDYSRLRQINDHHSQHRVRNNPLLLVVHDLFTYLLWCSYVYFSVVTHNRLRSRRSPFLRKIAS